jgi:hypothetical protein
LVNGVLGGLLLEGGLDGEGKVDGKGSIPLLREERRLSLIFSSCRRAIEGQFFLKQTKCLFAQRQIEYLGHIVSQRGVEPVSAKVTAIQQWPTPKNIRGLRGFLGLAGFYRRFIRGYATIAAPLTQLLKKDQFGWSHDAQLSNVLSVRPRC